MTNYHFRFRVYGDNYRLRVVKDETLAKAMVQAESMISILNADRASYITKEMYEELALNRLNMDREYELAKRLKRLS